MACEEAVQATASGVCFGESGGRNVCRFAAYTGQNASAPRPRDLSAKFALPKTARAIWSEESLSKNLIPPRRHEKLQFCANLSPLEVKNSFLVIFSLILSDRLSPHSDVRRRRFWRRYKFLLNQIKRGDTLKFIQLDESETKSEP